MSAFADALNVSCSVCNQDHIPHWYLFFGLHAYSLLVSGTVVYVPTQTLSRKFVYRVQVMTL